MKMRLVTALVAAIAVASCGGGSSGAEDGAAVSRQECERQIKAKLKAPSTAKFIDVTASARDDQTWTTTGTVAAENSFGGTVENQFTCTLRQSADGSFSGDARILG